MERLADDIARLYERAIVRTGKEPEFFVLVAFLVTFIIVRIITHAIHDRKGRLRNITVGNLHIHHLVWGILLLLITGYLALAFDAPQWRTTLSVLFGVGAALTLDEFALWLHLEDVYWAKEGRSSVDAVVIAAAILAIFLLGQDFWIGSGRLVVRFFGEL